MNVDIGSRGKEGKIYRSSRVSHILYESSIKKISGNFTVEAAALLKGLKLARDTGCNNLVVRSDNITVVDVFRFNESYSMVAAPVLDECRSYLVDSMS